MSITDQPNPVLSDIYGTFGLTKEASEGERYTLDDFARDVAIRTAEQYNIQGVEKIARLHERVREAFSEADYHGRSMAHMNFSDLEKQAAEGNPEPLNAFFGVDHGDDAGDILRSELIARLGG